MKRMFDFSKVQPVPAGVYHTQSSPDVRPPYRVHLRLQPNGYGVLVINAATVLHLNPTAAEYAYHFVKGTDPEAAAQEIASRYRVSKGTALQDYRDFAARVHTLISTPDLDQPGTLDGTARSLTIPAGTLEPGRVYSLNLEITRLVSTNSTSYPAAPGIAAVAMAKARSNFAERVIIRFLWSRSCLPRLREPLRSFTPTYPCAGPGGPMPAGGDPP